MDVRVILSFALLGASASRTIDPPGSEPPSLGIPLLVVAVAILLVVGVAAFIRSRHPDERP
jgi:hypothetical protein